MSGHKDETMQFGTVEQAIADIKAGKLILVADDEDRENEGDLICAAQLVTPELINFMIRKACGWVCLALTGERVDQLRLPQQTEHNTEEQRTAFTVSIDAAPRFGVTTGISAHDRARTIQVAVDPATVPADLRRPGHVPPLRARDHHPMWHPNIFSSATSPGGAFGHAHRVERAERHWFRSI